MLAINKLKNLLVILLLFFVWSQNSFAMNSWNFKVFYGDKEIGEHHFPFKKKGIREESSLKQTLILRFYSLMFTAISIEIPKYGNVLASALLNQ